MLAGTSVDLLKGSQWIWSFLGQTSHGITAQSWAKGKDNKISSDIKKKNETHGEMLDLEKLIFSDHFFTVKMSGKLGLVLARKVVTTYLCTKGWKITWKVWVI